MKTEFGTLSFQGCRSEALVRQIMSTLRMDQAEATALALNMLFRELIIFASLVTPVSEEAQGAA